MMTLGETKRRSPPFEQAVAEQQLAVDRAKDVDEYRAYLANHLDNLGEQYMDLGRVAEAMPFHRRALQIFRELNAAISVDPIYRLELLKSLIRLGTIKRHTGDSAAALKWFTEARTILERKSDQAQVAGISKIALAAVLDQEANALLDQGLADEAKTRLERAWELLQPRPEVGPAQSRERRRTSRPTRCTLCLGVRCDHS